MTSATRLDRRVRLFSIQPFQRTTLVMKSSLFRLSASISLLLVFTPVTAAGDWVEESNANTLHVMEVQARLLPETFSALGVETVDADIMDLGPGIHERSQLEARQLIADLEARKKTTEDPRVLQDIDILSKSLQDQIHTSKLNRKYLLPYYNLSQNLYFGFRDLLDPRIDLLRHAAALERLKK